VLYPVNLVFSAKIVDAFIGMAEVAGTPRVAVVVIT
jgi:hypothetical protein